MSLQISTLQLNDASAQSFTTTGIDTTGAGSLIVFAKHEGAVTGITITDSKGNTFTALTKENHANGDLSAQLFYVNGTPTVGTAHTFTIDFTGTDSRPYIRVGVWAFTETYTTLDVESTAEGVLSSAVDAGSLVTTAAAVLVVGVGEYAVGTFTPGTGWTETQDNSSYMEHRIETGSGTFDPVATWDLENSWAAVSVALKAAAGDTLFAQALF